MLDYVLALSRQSLTLSSSLYSSLVNLTSWVGGCKELHVILLPYSLMYGSSKIIATVYSTNLKVPPTSKEAGQLYHCTCPTIISTIKFSGKLFLKYQIGDFNCILCGGGVSF